MFKLIERQDIETEYTRCIDVLHRINLLTFLPESNKTGVIGVDGKEYPVPTQEQMVELFEKNIALVSRKIIQGFNRLELTPMAMKLLFLVNLLEAALQKHASEGKIYQTRSLSSDPLVPVHLNNEKQVWIWDTLKVAIDDDKLIYFPQEYSGNHRGLTKSEVVNNRCICAIPGWSVGLVESIRLMPQEGYGLTLGGRKQLETGFSPREYLQTMQMEVYEGETGKTLEDFIINFLTNLETTNEVSNDRIDSNSLWCLGQFIKLKYAEVVPTGWWNRNSGRVRLDMHRTGNKLCTKSWGGSTTVRLS